MKWAFIDYENVGSLGKVDLSSYERVIVFLGAKAAAAGFHRYLSMTSRLILSWFSSRQPKLTTWIFI